MLRAPKGLFQSARQGRFFLGCRCQGAAIAAAVSTLSAPAHAAMAADGSVTVHAEGTVSDFIAIFDINGYNCSSYNPCDPTKPTRFDTNSYGGLSRGQAFSVDMVFDGATGNVLSSSWVAKDGKASFGSAANGNVYVDTYTAAYSSPATDGIVVRSSLGSGDTVTPVKGISTYLTFQFTGADLTSAQTRVSSLGTAAEQGLLTGVTGTGSFNACSPYSSGAGIYTAACTSRMSFTFSSVSVNGVTTAVPEPTTWASFGLGLAMLSGTCLARRRVKQG
jgi:hypothetical protein